MSETKDAVDRLCWLCEEAAIRANEEFHGNLFLWLSSLREEIETTAICLHQAGILKVSDHVPFRLIIRRVGRGEERKVEWELFVYDPLNVLEYYSCIVKTMQPGKMRSQFDKVIQGKLVKRMGQWVRLLKHESEKLKTSSNSAASSPQTGPEVEKQTSNGYTMDEVCREVCKHERGRKTLKRILELTKDGKTQTQIATLNPGKTGFSPSNISEKLTLVRKGFPGFLPD